MNLRGRLGLLSSHRQIWLLFGVALISVAAIVAAVLVVLSPTLGELHALDTQLIPAIDRVDEATGNYASTAQTVQRAAVETDPAQRNLSFESLADSNSAGEAAWKAYKKLSLDLPGEDALERKFEADRKAGLDGGVGLVTGAAVSTEAVAQFRELSDVMITDLTKIRTLYETHVHQALHNADADIDATRRDIVIFAGIVFLGLIVAFGLAARSARERERKLEQLNGRLATDSTRNELEARLQRSLEMVHSEEASYALVKRALAKCSPGLAAELLLADSSRAHFRQVTTTPDLGVGGCAVMSPGECPAASRGQTQVWTSSHDIDACPYLQERASGACSAVCVPVSIAGETVGVMHATATDGHPPANETVVNIELISRKAGERIGMLRAFSRSEVQAHTDPLTGLMNRRSLEVEVRTLVAEDRPYVVAYGDLDHFKQLNDVYGHDAGDRALRLFARVVRDSLRPTDIPARYGGEEFVAVLPDCSVSDAVGVIDRLRERLADVQRGGTVPPFTVSFGIASSPVGTSFADTVELADAALLQAKEDGRDQVVIAAPDQREHSTNGSATAAEARALVAASD